MKNHGFPSPVMGDAGESLTLQPTTGAERYEALDVIRGVSLLGVLLINLLGGFRISLVEHILTFHTHPGWLDRAVDVLAAALLEFKAFALFSLMFGVGVGIQVERATARGRDVKRFLARRFLVLLAIGLSHMLLIWNGDILSLYALCGLLMLPLLRLSLPWLLVVGACSIALTFFPWDFLWPSEATLHGLAAEATRAYATGSMGEIMVFRWQETCRLIVPLLVTSLPKTWGLMLLGAAAWRAGLFREPDRHRGLLWTIFFVGGAVGGTATTLAVYSESTGLKTGIPPLLINAGSYIPLALAYAAGLTLWLRSPRAAAIMAPFAAAGRMALTNYLAQSVVCGFIFYGYGLGLMGRLGPAPAALIGVSLYAVQVGVSLLWLRAFRFGPVEWVWRSLTYGCRL